MDGIDAPPESDAAARPAAAPLSGIRVLDFSRVLAGPFLTQCLAALGADVVKVEAPGGDPTRGLGAPHFRGASYYFVGTNAGKRSIVLDLKVASGVELARRLAVTADVVVENFRPGVLEALGLGWKRLQEANPRLVVVSLSAFGLDAPHGERARPAFDLTIQARAGVLSIQGRSAMDGLPARLALPMGDLSGAAFGCMATLVALVARERTGVGTRVDVSLLEAQMAFLGPWLAQASLSDRPPTTVGSGHASAMPYGIYECQDGLLAVAVFTDRFWIPFLKAIGREDLTAEGAFATGPDRVRHRATLDAILRPLLQSKPRATWLERFVACGVPAEGVSDLRQALRDPVLAARGTIREESDGTRSLAQLAFPATFDGNRCFAGRAPVKLGGDRVGVLESWLGLSPQEQRELACAGAFGPEAAAGH